MASNFEYFQQGTVDFLNELKENNNREWFNENKSRYESYVKAPSKKLVTSMAEHFMDAGIPYVSDEKKSLFRINRDTRFSPNKDPYKTNFGVIFPFNEKFAVNKNSCFLGVYFHLDANESFIAGGLHMPDGNVIKQARNHIAEHYVDYYEVLESYEFKTEFPTTSSMGERLKRVPQGFDKDHPAAELLKEKNFTYICNLDFKHALSKDLKDIILRKSIAMLPLMEFFDNAINF